MNASTTIVLQCYYYTEQMMWTNRPYNLCDARPTIIIHYNIGNGISR